MITNLNTADGPRRTGRPGPGQHHAHTETPADLVPAAQNGPALPPPDESDMMSRVSRGRGRFLPRPPQ